MKKIKKQEGITLFVTLILLAVLLGVSASLLNITLKQHQLSGVSYDSEIAFQAANSGMECALFHDWENNLFDVNGDGTTRARVASLDCMDDNVADIAGVDEVGSGGEQRFRISFGDPAVCTEFSVYKFFEDISYDLDTDGPWVEVDGERFKDERCPEGSECTVIQSRGYNVPCDEIGVDRVVEREYTQVY